MAPPPHDVPPPADIDQRSAITDTTYLVGDAASSNSWSTIGSVSLQNGAPRLPVYVNLPTGQRLLVPVPATATVQDLQFQTLRRAANLNVQVCLGNSVMRTTGPVSAIVDGQDLVSDFLDHTVDRTFSLDALDATITRPDILDSDSEPSRSSLSTYLKSESAGFVPAVDPAKVVYVRWITTDDAVKTSKLQRLPVDNQPFDETVTLHHLYQAAVSRLCDGKPAQSTVVPTDVRLWLKDCPLVAKDNVNTLSELQMEGTVQEPVDIFVQLLGPGVPKCINQLTETANPQEVWGLNTTKRGISTLTTCLQILFKEMDRNIKLDTVLDVLLELTHFPPALVALEALWNTGFNDWSTDVTCVHLLADLFNSVCGSMVPDWVCPSAESKLEGCRAVFAWIRSLCLDAKSSSPPKHLYRIQIFQPPTNTAASLDGIAMFGPPETVELAKCGASSSDHLSGHKDMQSLAVSLEKPVVGFGRKYLLAGNITAPIRWQHFVSVAKIWPEFLESHALHRPDGTDYDNLLTQANKCPAFKMVGPMQLGSCLSAQLPVITLSAQGYVSKYDQQDVECSEREFYLWNIVEKRVPLRNVSPAEFISSGLKPIIRERKKAGAWEVDAWGEWTEQADLGDPDESVVICVDVSGSMASRMPHGWNPTRDSLGETASRLGEVQEFFNQFSTRLSSYGLATNVGLVTFSGRSNVLTLQPLTMLQLDFRERLANASAHGATAIFDAIAKAKDMLVEQKKDTPNTKCRIILFTDGGDNNSSVIPSALCQSLHDEDIVLDAIVIGSGNTRSLFKMARNTGGYAFYPQDQNVFFQIFLLETFIDIRTRPDVQKVPITNGWDSFNPKVADMRDAYTFPPCRPHPNQNDYFISLNDAQKFWKRNGLRSVDDSASETMSLAATTLAGSTPTSSSVAVGAKVLLSEVKAMVDNAHPNMSVFVSERNIGFWKVVMEGPDESPYQRGSFLLYVDIGLDFPRQPPAVRFITQILHPNISKHGRVCHPIFDREWSNTIHVYEVLQHIFGMLMTLESRDAIDPISALRFYTDPAEGRRLVRDYINRFASKPRASLEAEILSGNDTSSIAPSDLQRDDDTMSINSDSTIQVTPESSSRSKKSYKMADTALPSRLPLFYVKATQPCQPATPAHLPFITGQIIAVTKTDPSPSLTSYSWYEGEYTNLLGHPVRGRFPQSFAEPCPAPTPPPLPATTTSNIPYNAKALFAFTSPTAGDLPFAAGEHLTVTAVVDRDWLRGEIVDPAHPGRKRIGMFPAAWIAPADNAAGQSGPLARLRSSLGRRGSSLSGYLASQRGPGGGAAGQAAAARPPPLMAVAGAGGGTLPLTEGNLASVAGAGPRSEEGGGGSSRRVGRRASFFGMLKKAGSTK